MKLSPCRLSLLITLVLASTSSVCQVSCSEEMREVAVARAVREQASFDFPLEVTRLQDLTDTVIGLQTKALSNPIGADVHVVTFYRVAPSRYQVKDGKVIGETVELDDYHEWVAASDNRTGVVYLLEGSPDPISEFNTLLTDLHLRVSDVEGALGIFYFYLKVVQTEQPNWRVVGDEMKLESVALVDFEKRFPAAKRKSAFDYWWNGLPGNVKKSLATPAPRTVKDGFDVHFFFYSGGVISDQILTVKNDATVTLGKPRVLAK